MGLLRSAFLAYIAFYFGAIDRLLVDNPIYSANTHWLGASKALAASKLHQYPLPYFHQQGSRLSYSARSFRREVSYRHLTKSTLLLAPLQGIESCYVRPQIRLATQSGAVLTLSDEPSANEAISICIGYQCDYLSVRCAESMTNYCTWKILLQAIYVNLFIIFLR